MAVNGGTLYWEANHAIVILTVYNCPAAFLSQHKHSRNFVYKYLAEQSKFLATKHIVLTLILLLYPSTAAIVSSTSQLRGILCNTIVHSHCYLVSYPFPPTVSSSSKHLAKNSRIPCCKWFRPLFYHDSISFCCSYFSSPQNIY